MNFKGAFFLTTLHTMIKILAGIVVNKVVAVYLGPSGLAIIGQFQNFSAIVTGAANASIQTGIVRATAEKDCAEHREKVWSTSLILSVGVSILTSIVVLLLSEYLSKHIFYTDELSYIIQVFALSIVFYSLNLYVLSILNGLGEIKLFTIINISISIISLICISILSVFFKLEGALLGLILAQSVVFFVSYALMYKRYKNSFFKVIFSCFDKSIVKMLLHYGFVSFLSGLILALTMIAVRANIVNASSIDVAGLWEAVIKIGFYFNMLFALPISIYYLPKIASCESSDQVTKMVIESLYWITPVMFSLAYVIYLVQDFIILILFSPEFITIAEILVFVLIAEIARTWAGVFKNVFFAKKKLKIVIVNEFIWAVTFVFGSYMFMSKTGLEGVALVYVFACFIYLVMNLFSFFLIKNNYI